MENQGYDEFGHWWFLKCTNWVEGISTAVTGRLQLELASKPALLAAPFHGRVRRVLGLHAEQTQEPGACAHHNEQERNDPVTYE